MSDNEMRAVMADRPVPVFNSTAFTVPPSLSEATIAIVTTAGLHHADQQGWDSLGASEGKGPYWRADQSFRVLNGHRRDFRLGHWSPNFDRSGFAADLNVVFPIDRLDELAAEARISAVAPRHIAFVGAQDETLSTIRYDTGPAAAKVLLDDQVDVVLLTPV